MARTTEETLTALTAALADADAVIREAHGAAKDWRNTVKTERARVEEIVREETRDTILAIAADIHEVVRSNVDAILTELRARLLGETHA